MKKFKFIVRLCSVGTIFACFTGVYAADDCSRRSTTVPFYDVEGLIVIDAKVNGIGPLRFVLDTGASEPVISPEAAQRLGLTGTGQATVTAGDNRTQEARLADNVQFQIGQFVLPRRRLAISPLPSEFPFSGFLGAEFFTRFVVEVDRKLSRVTLIEPKTYCQAGAGTVIDLSFASGLPSVEAKIDGIKGKLKLDTGYNGGLALFAEFSDKHHLWERYKIGADVAGGRTITGEVRAFGAHVAELKIGNAKFAQAETLLYKETGGSNAAFAGAIGTELLERYDLVIDYSRKRLVLKPM